MAPPSSRSIPQCEEAALAPGAAPLPQRHSALSRGHPGTPSGSPGPPRSTELCPEASRASPGRDSTASPGSLCRCTIICAVKFFLKFRWNPLCITFCPLPLVTLFGTTEQSLAPFSCHHPVIYLCTVRRRLAAPTGLEPATPAQRGLGLP